jgi:hypothetical protein
VLVAPHESKFHRPYGSVGAIVDVKLVENMLDVDLHRVRRNDELLSNLSVGAPSRNALDHLNFAGSEPRPLDCRDVSSPFVNITSEDLPRQVLVDRELATQRLLDRRTDFEQTRLFA